MTKSFPKRGEVWFADFPLEEDESKTLPRPVIVLDEYDDSVGVLTVKVTKHETRDEWDYEIFYWKEAKLKMKSVARISKAIYLGLDSFLNKKGDLHEDDLKEVDKIFNEYIITLANQDKPSY